jgi:prevent-host-death family protein
MADVTVRDLRNHGGDVIDRVVAGQTMTVTKAGRPVAELRPLPRSPLSAEVLVERWRRLPTVDPEKLRDDVDRVIDQSL